MTVRSAFYGLLNSSTMINKDGGLYNCLASNIINSLQRGMKIIAIFIPRFCMCYFFHCMASMVRSSLCSVSPTKPITACVIRSMSVRGCRETV